MQHKIESPRAPAADLFATTFIASAPAGFLPAHGSAAVAATLREGWNRAAATWPSVSVPPEAFARFAAARVRPDDGGARGGTLRLPELLLTFACSRGDRAAIRLLQQRYFPVLERALKRRGLQPAFIDEICALQLTRLIVGDHGRPLILEYGGSGDLGAWLVVSALRAAFRLHRRGEREAAYAEAHAGHLDEPAASTADGYEAAVCGDLFRASFATALARLPARERSLLQQHYLSGWTLEEVAAHHRAHRATAARWLAAARRKLWAGTRAILQSRLGDQTGAESDGLIRAVIVAGHAAQAVPDPSAW